VVANVGNDLTRLLTLWREHYPKRATGGWWSLAGFSYQAAVFLARFFQRIEEGGYEPGELAELESLSDIVCPSDRLLRLIQVKRTLDVRAMRSFLEEAYFVTQLCRDELPELLPQLCFQVGCRTRITPQNPADVPMSEVLDDGDEACWKEMLGRIDAANPVLESRDPLDELSIVFWSTGIRDSAALLERLMGRLLSSFLLEGPDQMRSLGRELWSLYVAAERRNEWKRIGRVLTPEHVRPDSDATADRRVLAGHTPKLEHLRKGFFRDRPAVLAAVRERIDTWLSDVESEELISAVPVFWIAGRSGEGKSVLLLQVVADLLNRETSPALLQVTPQEVQDLVSLSSKWPPPTGSNGPPLIVVDDIYDLHDRDAWEQTVRETCTLATPPIALLTCGPTEQFEQFKGRLPEVFEVTPFELPRLSADEADEFVAWYGARSGNSRDPASLTYENPLLVQLMFELAQNERMSEFAQRFRRRLLHDGVFDTARTIVAATAMYLDTPLALVADSRVLDTLERLCRDDQLHFRIDGGPRAAVRLAHPHLAWLLFRDWVQAPETLEKALARELHNVLRIRAADATELFPFWPIRVLLGTTHLGTVGVGESPQIADRRKVIREIYRLQLETAGGSVDPRALPVWLELEMKIADLALSPSPLSEAIQAMERPDIASTLPGTIAAWVWLLAEAKPAERDQLQNAAGRFLRQNATNPNVASALLRIQSQSGQPDKALRLVLDWLNENQSNPQAHRVMALLWVANPSNPEVSLTALRWLDANATDPGTFLLLNTCIVASSSDSGVRQRATQWLDANASHPSAHEILRSLLAANPADAGVRQRATQWLDANASDPSVHQLLMSLMAVSRSDSDIRQRATRWLDANAAHPSVPEFLRRLIAANPSDSDVRQRAMQWLDVNASHSGARELLRSLIAASPSDAETRQRSMRWLDANPSHSGANEILRSLIAASPSDAEARQRSMRWLDANPLHSGAHELLRSLIAANPTDADFRMRGIQWLDANKSHSSAHELLRSLIAANPTDADFRMRAMQWLDANKSHSGAHEVLRSLVVANPNDADSRLRAIQWIDPNASQSGVHELLRSLIVANPSDAEVRQCAMRWLDANASKSGAAEILRSLITANPLDAEANLLGMHWLEANPSHKDAHRVIASLLSANPTDADIERQAIRWLDLCTVQQHAYRLIALLVTAHPTDAALRLRATQWMDANPAYAAELLRRLITGSGDASWMKRGSEYVADAASLHPEQILVALLTVSQGAQQYVNLALNFTQRCDTSRRRAYVLSSLSRVLIDNVPAAITYLRGTADASRKKVVRDSISHAMKQEGTLATAAVEALGILAREVPEHVPAILIRVLQLGASVADVDAFVARWLSANFRREGYGRVKRALQDRPDMVARLRALPDLARQVLSDLAESGLTPRISVAPRPSPPPRITLPKAGERVEAELIEERTKKQGWKARHLATGLAGPIQNSAVVPPERKPGDRVTLVIKMATERAIAFAWSP